MEDDEANTEFHLIEHFIIQISCNLRRKILNESLLKRKNQIVPNSYRLKLDLLNVLNIQCLPETIQVNILSGNHSLP